MRSPVLQAEVVGPGPTGPCHRHVYLGLMAAQRQVHRITEQAVTGPGAANEVSRDVQPGS